MRSGKTAPAERPPGQGSRGAAAWVLAAAGPIVSCLACAQLQSPPGVGPDSSPPQLREVSPADGSVIADFDGSLRLTFDEPITVPSGFEREIFFSPADPIRVDYGFSHISIRPEDGWREGAVYLFRLPEGISDIPPLNNELEEGIEVMFSTGPEITGTRIRGQVDDRLTGEALPDARVLFLSLDGDSIPYTAVSDTGGNFELSALPPDEYRAFAFTDLNSNLRLERRLEPYDSTTFVLEGASDVASVELRVTEPDSTPPELARVRARDTVTLALEFDDALDPRQSFGTAQVTVADTAGTERETAAVRLAEPGEAEAPTPGEPAPDSLPPDTLPTDTLPTDTLPADTLPPAEPPAPDMLTPAAAPLPSPVLLVRLERPLEAGAYVVTARDVRNLRDLVGGGEVRFEYSPPEVVPEAEADTLP